MSDLVEKMATAHFAAMVECSPEGVYMDESGLRGMRAALVVLANNDDFLMSISDAVLYQETHAERCDAIRDAILAAASTKP